MPKILEYPRASLKKSLELAKAVEALGDSCSVANCAEKMNRKDSGPFMAIVSAAGKFGLVDSQKGKLTTTKLFKSLELSYNDQEKKIILLKSFLKVPLFKELYNKFIDKELPINMLEKILIREFDVDKKLGSRVAKYFIEGAKQVELLKEDNKIKKMEIEESEETEEPDKIEPELQKEITSQNFAVHIMGPGMNSRIELKDKDDIEIVDAMLNKVKKKLEKKETENEDTESSN